MQGTLQERYQKLKKGILEREFSRLSGMQREAVFQVNGPLLILAGAGSGKTTVLVNRIANIIRYGNAYHSDVTPMGLTESDLAFLEEYADSPEHDEESRARAASLLAVAPAPPWSILAITFTNKAAGELKERIEKVLGPEGQQVWAFTFHSACVRILRREIERLGYTRDFTIYDSDDSMRVIKEGIKQENLNTQNFPPRAVLSVIGKAKDSQTTAEQFCEANKGDYRLERIGRVYRFYEKSLRDANALDFDDIILHTVRLLREFSEVREYYQNRFRYILVDEYQDTNMAQYQLVSLLTGKRGNLCVVGDDDQSIYKFRGATIENILSFEEQFRGARTIRLEQNYRSTQNILNAANQVIANNTARKGKTLWTENGEGARVKLFQAEDEVMEARFIAETINEAVFRDDRKYGDFAVLYRVNAQSNGIETALRKSGIPYKIIGGTRFYDRREIKDVLAYLQVINNPADDLRLRRIINEPKRGIGNATVEQLSAAAGDTGTSMYDVLLHVSEYPALTRAAGRLRSFIELLEDLRRQLTVLPLSELVKRMLEKTSYLEALAAEEPDKAQDRAQNVNELISNIVRYEQEHEEPSLSNFLEEIALISDIDHYEGDLSEVVLMTMHSSKGLEFPVVFIAGMEEGIFPGMQSMLNPDELEEERRLAYVGITRAKEQLYLSCATRRLMYGSTDYNRVSRFVGEIPKACLEDLNASQPKLLPTRPAPRNQKAAHSQELRSRPSSLMGGGASASPSPRPASRPQAGGGDTFKVGMRVRHAAFGEGMVVTATPMGNDMLVEVAFDRVGTKKLMKNYAKLTVV